MKWPTASLREIAPAQASNVRFSHDDQVWHLTLDQIESQTGYVVDKKMAPASEAGTSTYVFDDGNVLYSKLRPYLNKVLCPNEAGIATTELVPLRPRADILDRRYLTYYLRSNRFLGFANIIVAGVKMPRIIMAKFWDHQVPLPPLSEQRQIVEILDQADALRKKRAEADAKASRILPALFYKMFGDPATNPIGWPKTNLGDVAIDMRYGTSVMCHSEGAGWPVLRIPNVVSGSIATVNLKYAKMSESEVEKLLVEEGDVLFVRTNGNRDYVARCAVFELHGEYLFASYLIRMRLDKSKVDPKFLSASLAMPSGRQAMGPYIRTTAGQSNISKEGLSQIPIIIPPIAVQKAFRREIAEIERVKTNLDGGQKSLERLFDVLIHRAFTGALTAMWREAHMKEVLAEMEDQARVLESGGKAASSAESDTRGFEIWHRA